MLLTEHSRYRLGLFRWSTPTILNLLELIEYLMVRAHGAVFIDKAKIAYIGRNATVIRIVQICNSAILKSVRYKANIIFSENSKGSANQLATHFIVKRTPTAF